MHVVNVQEKSGLGPNCNMHNKLKDLTFLAATNMFCIRHDLFSLRS